MRVMLKTFDNKIEHYKDHTHEDVVKRVEGMQVAYEEDKENDLLEIYQLTDVINKPQ
jgi:hypothetical protein